MTSNVTITLKQCNRTTVPLKKPSDLCNHLHIESDRYHSLLNLRMLYVEGI